MSKITVHNWKQTDIEGSAFELIPPVYHVTYWEVPKWWYKGDRTVYTSCARVDLNEQTSIYIDGTTPLMEITLDYDGDKLRSPNWRDIRRVLICAKDDIAAINQGVSDAYADIEFFKDYYITRVNNYALEVIDPLINVLKPTFYSELPIAVGSSSPFDTGTWNGGVEPITYEWRYKAQNYKSDEWFSVGDWKTQPNEAIQETISLPEDSDAWYIHIESRAVDAEGTIVYNNSALRRAIPRVKKEPGSSIKYSAFNTYEEGSELVFDTATFYGGVPPVEYRHRIQQRNTPDDNWTTGTNTQYDNTVQTARQTITFSAGAQVRIQCQAVDSSQGELQGAWQPGEVKEIIPAATQPLEIAPNGGANWLGGNVYEVGQTVYGKTAAFTGGIEPITYRWRVQTRATPQDSWNNATWTNVTNGKIDVVYVIQDVGQLRIQSQAKENNPPNSVTDSFTGAQTVSS